MILKNAKIVLEDHIIENGWIELEDGKIKDFGEGKANCEGTDLKGKIVMPGFIDPHVHGGYDTALEDCTNSALNKFASEVVKEGVTRYCQATVTQPLDVMDKVMSFYKTWMEEENPKGAKARQLGMHIEGPFISAAKKGAHSEELLMDASTKIMDKWIKNSGNNIKVITYAVERDPNGAFTRFLLKNDVLPSIGHTNCSAKEFEDIAFKSGARRVTHLYNGMSGVSHYTKGNGKEAGLATAALYHDKVICEMITDGIHLNDETIKLTYKVKKDDGISLVTDAMRAKGLKDGDYKLGPLDVYKKGMSVKLKSNNVVAGSVATFDHCFRYFRKVTNASYLSMAKLSSANAAKQLNVFDRFGSIAKGKVADLVVLDSKDNVTMTIVDGEIAYKK